MLLFLRGLEEMLFRGEGGCGDGVFIIEAVGGRPVGDSGHGAQFGVFGGGGLGAQHAFLGRFIGR